MKEIENLMNKKFFKEKTKDSSLLSIFLKDSYIEEC